MIGCELRQNLVADVGRLHAVDDVGARGQHEVAVAAPQDRLLEFVIEPCDLRQRHRRRRFGVVMVRPAAGQGRGARSGTARATTSICSMPSRYWVTV